jgi:hypothetical protein
LQVATNMDITKQNVLWTKTIKESFLLRKSQWWPTHEDSNIEEDEANIFLNANSDDEEVILFDKLPLYKDMSKLNVGVFKLNCLS